MLLKSKYHEDLNYLGKQMLRPKKGPFRLTFGTKELETYSLSYFCMIKHLLRRQAINDLTN